MRRLVYEVALKPGSNAVTVYVCCSHGHDSSGVLQVHMYTLLWCIFYLQIVNREVFAKVHF
jgi:hypothetical protein